MMYSVGDLCQICKGAGYVRADVAYDELFWRMREADVLVIDDLGAEQSSSWATEKLFQLINYRYNQYSPTVITANPEGLNSVDKRISSRLSDAGLVRKVSMDLA